MQLIIVLCLIAKLALVSGDCDVGKTVNDFDINKFTGTWNFLYYLPNEDDDNLECVVDTYSVPYGNISNVTTIAFDKREGRGVNFTGQVSDWDNTGFNITHDNGSQWNGKMYVVAVDYDRYFIGKLCSDQSDTAVTNRFPVIIYVAIRNVDPDDTTLKDVRNALSDNDIPFDQLKSWNADRS